MFQNERNPKKNESWNRDKIIINDVFTYAITHEIMNDNYESRLVTECCQRQN